MKVTNWQRFVDGIERPLSHFGFCRGRYCFHRCRSCDRRWCFWGWWRVDGDAREGRKCLFDLVHRWYSCICELYLVRGIWSPRVGDWGSSLDRNGFGSGAEAELGSNFFAHTWIHVDGLQWGWSVAGVLRNHRRWKRNRSDGTDAWLAFKVNVDAMLFGQSTNHEEAKKTTRRLVEFRRIGNTLVECDEVRLSNAESRVRDLDLHAVGGLVARDRHLGRRIREVGCVVEKLGKQVSHIGNDRTTKRRGRDLTDLDSIEVLDLGEGRTHDVLGCYRATPLTWRTVTGKHEEALCVSTHTGCHMVETVKPLQYVRVLLVSLQIGDQVQHAVVQLLVSTTEVNEHFRNVSAASSLFGRHLHSGALHRVEGVYESTDLIVGFLWNLTNLRRSIVSTYSAKLGHSSWKTLLRNGLSLIDETGQWTDDRTTDHEDQDGEQEDG